jgi:glutamate racemase
LLSPHDSPVGVFDSGFGGLTVLKELQKTLPHEQFIYLGDTAHLPYGTKSRETIIRYTQQNCAFLTSKNVKLIIIACNSATSMALEALSLTVPVIGVIDPVIHQVVQSSPHGKIGILGTRATISSGVYQSKIRHHLPHAQITATPSPLLVSLVEEGFIDHPITHLAIQEYIQPLIAARVDTVILACTHFPLLKELIEKALDPSVHVIDPAISTAQAAAQLLTDLNLHSQNHSDTSFYVTDDPDKFARLGPQFLGVPITDVQPTDLTPVLN